MDQITYTKIQTSRHNTVGNLVCYLNTLLPITMATIGFVRGPPQASTSGRPLLGLHLQTIPPVHTWYPGAESIKYVSAWPPLNGYNLRQASLGTADHSSSTWYPGAESVKYIFVRMEKDVGYWWSSLVPLGWDIHGYRFCNVEAGYFPQNFSHFVVRHFLHWASDFENFSL